MANDNKNTHELASDLDDDTSELELLSATYTADPALDYEAESDAATHSFDSLDAERERQSLGTLQVELRERDEYIGRLEFDLEQLRARSNGLEAELKAREALTEGVTAELTELRQALDAARDRLEQRDRGFAELESRLEASEASLQDARHAAADDAALRELTADRDALRAELDRLQQDAGSRADTASAHEETIALQLAEIDSLATRLAEISSEYESERGERQALEAQCETLEERVQRLATRVAELEVTAECSRPLQQENARLTGGILSQAHEIRDLAARAAKIEAYADTLRRKLQAQGAELETVSTNQRSVQAALDDSLRRVAELRDQVEAERSTSAEMAERHRHERERLESELRNTQAELETARNTIAESHATHEQLAADLIETTGSRLSLETQLSQAEEDNRKKVETLERQVKRLKHEVEELEGKVANKDAAISVLLSELSSKPPAATSEVQADAAHRPADRRARGGDEKHGADKERITRLLVGTIDGQEVRFPLFKNKLTIGRTAHNDIQLKQQFISRRHAVVVCDNDSTRIVDWGSKNGIHVNGVRVSEKVLKSGDQLTVGAAEFRFEELPKR